MSWYKENFIEIKPIGIGGFSTVFMSLSIVDGKQYAIKKIPIKSDEIKNTFKEINFLETLDSKYVVKYFDSWIEDNYYISTTDKYLDQRSLLFNPERSKVLHIQMELCSMTLKKFIKSLKYTTKNSISAHQYTINCKVFDQLLMSINYLHQNKIIHRDLKPENIMFRFLNGKRLLKLVDFGLSTFHDFVDQSHTKYQGTIQYRAPEMNNTKYDTKADMYSLGVIMGELFNFDINVSIIDVEESIKNKYIYMMSLYSKCVSIRKIDRPTSKIILKNKQSWFYPIHKMDIHGTDVYEDSLESNNLNQIMLSNKNNTIVFDGLESINLSFDSVNNLNLWWNGEILGKSCARNIVDTFFTLGLCAIGGLSCVAVGSMAGPIGTIVGAVAAIGGGISSLNVKNFAIDELRQSTFDIPKEEAIKNAYNFLGVKKHASNKEINDKYRKLCQKHHPDKGGKNEYYLLVQVHMGVIMLARGEL